jgi:hypothetical protein
MYLKLKFMASDNPYYFLYYRFARAIKYTTIKIEL